MPEDLKDRLAMLTPEARARVEATMKEHVERELATTVGPGGKAAAFSRGILFSKSGAAMHKGEEVILPQLAEMDDQKFSTFVERIKTLKSHKPQ